MATIPEFHRCAAEAFSVVVEDLPDDPWDAPTPCAKWDMRTLLHHNVSENLWVPPLMAGETIASVGDCFEGDILGDDPKAAWRASVGPACDALDAPHAMTRTVHLSFGDVPGEEYGRQRLVDFVVHAWDLAQGGGVPYEIPEELAEPCYEWAKPLAPMLASMPDFFGKPLAYSPDDSMAVKLLRMLGRAA